MTERTDKLIAKGIDSKGYGKIPKMVMQDQDLTIEAKAIYAYFASYAGAGNTAFPGIKKILHDLKIGEERYYKHRKLLEKKKYITVERVRVEGGVFDRNIYTLNDFVPFPENPCMDNRGTDNRGTNKNSTKINSTNKERGRNSAKAKYDDDSPYMKLAKRLYGYLKKRNPEQSEPNWQTWADDFRKTVELDKKSLDNVVRILDWSQKDEFWRKNIMSPAKFRKQYDKLALQMNEEIGRYRPQQPAAQNNVDWSELEKMVNGR